jgi:hypothetical protein
MYVNLLWKASLRPKDYRMSHDTFKTNKTVATTY